MYHDVILLSIYTSIAALYLILSYNVTCKFFTIYLLVDIAQASIFQYTFASQLVHITSLLARGMVYF